MDTSKNQNQEYKHIKKAHNSNNRVNWIDSITKEFSELGNIISCVVKSNKVYECAQTNIKIAFQ